MGQMVIMAVLVEMEETPRPPSVRVQCSTQAEGAVLPTGLTMLVICLQAILLAVVVVLVVEARGAWLQADQEQVGQQALVGEAEEEQVGEDLLDMVALAALASSY